MVAEWTVLVLFHCGGIQSYLFFWFPDWLLGLFGLLVFRPESRRIHGGCIGRLGIAAACCLGFKSVHVDWLVCDRSLFWIS